MTGTPLASTWRVGVIVIAEGFESHRTAPHPQLVERTTSATAVRATRTISPKSLSQQASLPFPSSVGPLVVQRAICRVAQPPPSGTSPRRTLVLRRNCALYRSISARNLLAVTLLSFSAIDSGTLRAFRRSKKERFAVIGS